MKDRTKITERDHRRHLRFFAFFRPIMAWFMKHRFNYEWDDLSGIEGPYLLLSNHNTNLDPIFIGIATKNQLYFVSSEHVMRNKFTGGLLAYFLSPILHFKGKAGVATISNMLRCLKNGYNVAIFPEGNRSFNGLTCDFLPTIGKLARKSGAKLVTFRLEGGYLTQPRWAFTSRKGKLRGRLVNVYDTNKLKSMTDDEVNAAIVEDLHEDAYATEEREMAAFKGRKPAYGLETTLFACPKCKSFGNLHSTKNHLRCDCGYSALFNEYGRLINDDPADTAIASLTVTEVDRMQYNMLSAIAHRGQISPLFEDTISVMEIDENHNITNTRTGLLRAYFNHAEFNGYDIRPEDIAGLAIRSRNTIVLHSARTNGQYEIKGTNPMFNALKYLYLYNILDPEHAAVV